MASVDPSADSRIVMYSNDVCPDPLEKPDLVDNLMNQKKTLDSIRNPHRALQELSQITLEPLIGRVSHLKEYNMDETFLKFMISEKRLIVFFLKERVVCALECQESLSSFLFRHKLEVTNEKTCSTILPYPESEKVFSVHLKLLRKRRNIEPPELKKLLEDEDVQVRKEAAEIVKTIKNIKLGSKYHSTTAAFFREMNVLNYKYSVQFLPIMRYATPALLFISNLYVQENQELNKDMKHYDKEIFKQYQTAIELYTKSTSNHLALYKFFYNRYLRNQDNQVNKSISPKKDIDHVKPVKILSIEEFEKIGQISNKAKKKKKKKEKTLTGPQQKHNEPAQSERKESEEKESNKTVTANSKKTLSTSVVAAAGAKTIKEKASLLSTVEKSSAAAAMVNEVASVQLKESAPAAAAAAPLAIVAAKKPWEMNDLLFSNHPRVKRWFKLKPGQEIPFVEYQENRGDDKIRLRHAFPKVIDKLMTHESFSTRSTRTVDKKERHLFQLVAQFNYEDGTKERGVVTYTLDMDERNECFHRYFSPLSKNSFIYKQLDEIFGSVVVQGPKQEMDLGENDFEDVGNIFMNYEEKYGIVRVNDKLNKLEVLVFEVN